VALWIGTSSMIQLGLGGRRKTDEISAFQRAKCEATYSTQVQPVPTKDLWTNRHL